MAPGRTDFQRHIYSRKGQAAGTVEGGANNRIRTCGRKNKEELKGTRGGERETGSARGTGAHSGARSLLLRRELSSAVSGLSLRLSSLPRRQPAIFRPLPRN